MIELSFQITDHSKKFTHFFLKSFFSGFTDSSCNIYDHMQCFFCPLNKQVLRPKAQRYLDMSFTLPSLQTAVLKSGARLKTRPMLYQSPALSHLNLRVRFLMAGNSKRFFPKDCMRDTSMHLRSLQHVQYQTLRDR